MKSILKFKYVLALQHISVNIIPLLQSQVEPKLDVFD